MSDTTLHTFAMYRNQQVLILEQFNAMAWVSFKDGSELEVSMFDLDLI